MNTNPNVTAATGARVGGRVVVLGASMSGLLAARVLSDHAASVVVVERDQLPDAATDRKGVPQGRHAHGLLARGQQILELLFPGIRQTLQSRGAVFGDLAHGCWVVGGHRLRLPLALGQTGFVCPRPLLEQCVRERVGALPHVEIRSNTDILGVSGSSGRVSGVKILPRVDGGAAETLAADLVVDATGRGSKLPRWLQELGYLAPHEERVPIGLRYTTVVARRRPQHASGGLSVVIGAAPPNPRSAAALAIGADRWIISLGAYLGESAGTSWEEMLEFARQLPSEDLYRVMLDSEPLGETVGYSFPHSQRRRYDQLRRHPPGIVAIGDAVCSFNPVFGQGMSVAACEALALGQAARRWPLPDVWKSFYRQARPIVDVPWSMAVGSDLKFREVEGPRPVTWRWMTTYLDRLSHVAAEDPVVGEALMRVMHLLSAPQSLLGPRVLWRVLRGAPQEKRLEPLAPFEPTHEHP